MGLVEVDVKCSMPGCNNVVGHVLVDSDQPANLTSNGLVCDQHTEAEMLQLRGVTDIQQSET